MFFNPSAFAVKTVKEIKCIVVIVDFFEIEYHNANERWNSHGVKKKKQQTNKPNANKREGKGERELNTHFWKFVWEKICICASSSETLLMKQTIII